MISSQLSRKYKVIVYAVVLEWMDHLKESANVFGVLPVKQQSDSCATVSDQKAKTCMCEGREARVVDLGG